MASDNIPLPIASNVKHLPPATYHTTCNVGKVQDIFNMNNPDVSTNEATDKCKNLVDNSKNRSPTARVSSVTKNSPRGISTSEQKHHTCLDPSSLEMGTYNERRGKSETNGNKGLQLNKTTTSSGTKNVNTETATSSSSRNTSTIVKGKTSPSNGNNLNGSYQKSNVLRSEKTPSRSDNVVEVSVLHGVSSTMENKSLNMSSSDDGGYFNAAKYMGEQTYF